MILTKLARFIPLIALSACATTEPVYLQSTMGETVQCGPNYPHLGFFTEKGHETDAELRARCVADYEARGFLPVPAPSSHR